ncbi:MAG TPA: hypothetical protein VID68_14080 [Solirubrobacteraceae bacterium]
MRAMLDANNDTVLRWTCPGCRLEWYDRGRGFHGQRFSTCLRCGTDACEPNDTRRPFDPPRPELVATDTRVLR